jgi:hypothetical protein
MSRIAPQFPPNDSTVQTVDLPSTAGFVAGELIYTKNGSNGPIDNSALTQAPFDLTTTAPLYAGAQGGFQTYVGDSGSVRKAAATLTNGNIVRVYIRTNARPAFIITDTAGAVVVAQTDISTTFTNNSCANISVAALSGGGFVATWTNDSGGTTQSVNFAIYSNAGVVVTAATQSTGITTNNDSGLAALGLPNGGFVLAVINSSSNLNRRVFSSTGTPVDVWSGLFSSNDARANIGMAARSDSSFIVFIPTSGSAFGYSIQTALGINIVSGASFNPTYGGASNSNTRCNDASIMSDGTTFVLFYNSFSSTTDLNVPCYRFIPTGNVLGPEFVFPPANINRFWTNTQSTSGSPSPTQYSILGLPGNTFIAVFGDSQRAMNYFFGNSTGAVISGPFPYDFPGVFLPIWKVMSVVPSGSFINIYTGTSANTDSVGQLDRTYLTRVDTATFRPVPAGSVATFLVGSATSSVNAYAKTSSGPSYARFVASTNTTVSADVSMSVISPQSALTQAFCDGLSCATLTNGNYVVAYRQQSGYQNFAAIISPSGVVQSTISVGVGAPIEYAAGNQTSVCALSGGGFVVSYSLTSDVVAYSIFTSSGSLSGQGTITGANLGNSLSQNLTSAGLAANRFAICYCNGSQSFRAAVFEGSGTLVNNVNLSSPFASPQYISIAAIPGGGFSVAGYSTGEGAQRLVSFDNSGGNLGSVQFSGTENSPNRQLVISPAGFGVANVDNSSAFLALFSCNGQSSSLRTNTNNSIAVSNSTGNQHIGMTGVGSMVFINTSTNPVLYAFDVGLNGGANLANISPSARLSLAMSFWNPTATPGPFTWFTPGNGYRVGMCAMDASRRATFTVFNAFPYAESATLTAGTTLSGPVPVNPGTSGVLNGYCLQGVSITDATAGGTGKVQTNGLAALNTNYSASAPATAFDFTSPNGSGVSGVRGTAIGRNVNLLGNK